MTQTLLALLALSLAMLMVFNQQRDMLHIQSKILRNEVATQATAVAVDRLEEIGSMAYDESTKGGTTITAATQLTLKADFTTDAPVDDVDDFDDVSVERTRPTWVDTLRFRVESRVSYAEALDPGQEVATSTTRTKFKKVSVAVYALDLPRPDTIRIAQSFSCGSRCNW